MAHCTLCALYAISSIIERGSLCSFAFAYVVLGHRVDFIHFTLSVNVLVLTKQTKQSIDDVEPFTYFSSGMWKIGKSYHMARERERGEWKKRSFTVSYAPKNVVVWPANAKSVSHTKDFYLSVARVCLQTICFVSFCFVRYLLLWSVIYFPARARLLSVYWQRKI